MSIGFAAFWIGQLVFPTVIFLLTFGRAIGSYGLRQSFRGSILGLMLRDGELQRKIAVNKLINTFFAQV